MRGFSRVAGVGLVLALGLAGCEGSITPNIAVGTTKAELLARLGPPLETKTRPDGRELWYYRTTFDTVFKADQSPPTVWTPDRTPPADEHFVHDEDMPITLSAQGVVTKPVRGFVHPSAEKAKPPIWPFRSGL